MNLIEKSLCVEWYSIRGVKALGLAQINFGDKNISKISFLLPQEFLKCVSLTLAIEAMFVRGMPNSLFWVRDWGMWSEKTEKIGIAFWKKYRPGDKCDLLAEYPGHLFSQDEEESLRALLLLPIIFQWDAHWISSDGEAVVNIKHDGLLEIFFTGDGAGDRINELIAWEQHYKRITP